MSPRRALPPEPDDQINPDDQFSSRQAEPEPRTIRHQQPRMPESQDTGTPRRAFRALPDDDDDDPTLTSRDRVPRYPGQIPVAAQTATPADETESDHDDEVSVKPWAGGRAFAAEPRSTATVDKGRSRRWSAYVIVATVLGLAGLFGVGTIPADSAPLPQTIPLVTSISRICPAPADDTGTLIARAIDGGINVRTVGNARTTTLPGNLEIPDQIDPLVISPATPRSGVSGGSLVVGDNEQWWGPCQSPLDDQYVQLPDAAGAQLMIVNPELSDALVDVTLSGPDGEITADGLRGITIPADSQHVIDLGAVADSGEALGARVRTSLGRVAVSAQTTTAAGSDFAASTIQGTNLVVPGVPGDATRTVVLLTNPGTGRSAVQIEVVSAAGRFVLPGFESLSLNAQRTTAVDLTDAIGGVPVSLVISSPDAVAASVAVTAYGDMGIQPAQVVDESVAGTNLMGVVPGSGELQLANPSDDEATVVVNWGEGQASATLFISGGSVGSISIPEGAQSVRVTSTAPLFGALLLGGQGSGFAVAQLEAAARADPMMPVEIDVGLGG